MNTKDVQTLLASSKFYRGDIDGILGPKTRSAVRLVLSEANPAFLKWTEERQLVAAAQIVLDLKGHEPGAIDGYCGHNTREALSDFYSVLAHGAPRVIERTPVAPQKHTSWPLQSQMESFFGKAGGPQCTAGSAALPFAFSLSWNREQSVTRIVCHERVARPMENIFAEAVREYGSAEFVRLGLNIYGGCFNYRKMRGGRSLSTHAYGAAVDLDPENNQLRWGRDRAHFAREEYNIFWNIVEAHGAVSLGRAANMDWMHFQFARL